MGVYSATVHFPAALERHLFDQQVAAPFDDYICPQRSHLCRGQSDERVGAYHPIRNRGSTEELCNSLPRPETVNEFTYAMENGTMTIPHAGSWSLQVQPCTGVHDVHATRQLGVSGWVIVHNPYNAHEEGENE